MTHKGWLKILVSSILLLTCFNLFSLDPKKAVTQYMINKWQEEDGLPQNFIRSVLQTSDGYVWIGTEEGLARFDGVKFKIFDKYNTPSLTHNYIFCLFEDSQKRLWVGTLGGGLLEYLPQTGTFKHYGEKEGLSRPFIYCVAEDNNKNLWVGTDGGGAFQFNGNRFKKYTVKNGLPDNGVRIVFCDRGHNNIWFGTAKGLAQFKNGTFTPYGSNIGLPKTVIYAIYQDKLNNLWVGTDSGLFVMENGQFIQPAEKLKGCPIYAIFEDSNKNLWIGSGSEGLIRYANGKFSALTKNDGLSDNFIISITEDNEKNLWVGTVYGGVNQLRDGKVTMITTKEGLSDGVIYPIYEDSRGYLWFGTNKGVNCYKNGQFRYFSTKDGLSHNAVNALCEDQDGNMWVGTEDGINRLELLPSGEIKGTRFLKKNYIACISVDKQGILWVGTFKGLKRLHTDGTELPKSDALENVLNNEAVVSVYEDRQRNVWISTYRKGLRKYTHGRLISYTKKDGLSSDAMYFVYEDADSVLWMGSQDGITRLKDGKFTVFTKKDGLFHSNIFQILEDKKGCFWMSSNKGIFRVRKNDLNEVAKGKLKQVDSVIFDKEEGMITSECNGGQQSLGCRTRDGRLWFPTTQGVAMIDPENIQPNPITPVAINLVLLDGVPSAIQPNITFRYDVKRLEIFYSGMSFSNPKKVKFRYKLEGYDEQWIDASTGRSASYTNLDGGTYTFRVTACNNDGVWNEQAASLSITVIPPVWKTGWFIVLAAIAFSILSYLLIAFFRKYIALASFWKRHKYMGPFRLMDKIGSGGMGTVYKARNMMDKSKVVAVKVLKEEMFSDENSVKRFKQEASIIDQLDHPNIIKIIERGQSKNNLFIAMELLQGKTLTQKITDEKRLEMGEAIHIMRQVSDALAKIHSKNIIHRDIKPDNIMLVTQGEDHNFVKILDFGLAKTQYQTRLTQTGVVMGTICYMAPEQICGKGSMSSSDIYSLGIIFYEMLSGEKPFLGETTIDTMRRIMDSDPIEIERYRPDVPPMLSTLIMNMLEKDREKRPSVLQILDVLANLK
ncbi:MAG: two-component regulator propeller domain-containing protein [Candidatus Omnitrophota bacterium]